MAGKTTKMVAQETDTAVSESRHTLGMGANPIERASRFPQPLGLMLSREHSPRALPWASMTRPFRAKESPQRELHPPQ